MEPDFSVTMARLVSLRLPVPKRVRRVLPARFRRVDALDLDAEDLLDRELDLGLVRAGVDEERVLALVDEPVALLGDDRREDDVARVLVDARLRSRGDLLDVRPFAATNASRAAAVKTMSSRDEHVVGVELVARRARGPLRGCAARQRRARRRGRARRATSCRSPSAVERRRAAAFVEGTSPRTSDSTTWRRPPRARSESAAEQRCGDHLLGGALRVVARRRAVDDATAAVLGRADRALTGAAGALLLERLAAGTGDLAATLGLVRALACGGELRDDHLVDQRDVGLDVEELAGSSTEPTACPGVDDVDRAAMLRLPSRRCGRRRGGHERRGRRP